MIMHKFIINVNELIQNLQLSIKQGVMTSVITIIVPIVLSVIFIAVSFYLYTIFCHPQDSGLGTSLVSKIVVITGQSLAWAQLLLVILDLSVDSSRTMELIYSIVYVAIFILTVFVLPLFSGLYQADDDDSKCKQFVRAFIEALIISAVWCAITFISFIWLSKYTDISGHQKQIHVALYLFLFQALVGWILLVINGALGLVFFPYDLIMGFIRRPKKITKQEAFDLKKQLQNRSDQLIEQGQKLQVQEQQFQSKSQQMNFFSRRRRQGQLKDLVSSFKSNINKLQSDYQGFDGQLHIASQNPFIPYLKLAGGIVSVIFSFVWLIQLAGSTIYINQKPAFQFLDSAFASLDSGSGGFIASILYGLLVVYMLICLIKGNVIFGIKIPYVMSIHPLEVNKTYLNSMLFNSSIMLITSLSILEMSVIAFPNYLKDSYIGTFFMSEVRYLPLFGFLYKDRIYTIVFLVFVGLALLYLAIKICRQRRKQTRRKSIGKSA